jgi:uncharacterized protein (TIGR03382 family)
LVGPALSDASGWGAFEYFSTIRFADVDADGRDDVCARSAAGLHCWLSDGNGFPTRVDGPAWSDAAGFGLFLYPPSLRLAGGGPRCRPVAEVCGNAQDDDCDGEVDEGCAVPPPVPPPTPPVSPPTTPAPEAPPPGGTVFGGCQATGAGPLLGLALLALAARRRRG